jgi:hypothetical protein
MTIYRTFSNPTDFSDATKQITTNADRGDFLVLTQTTQQANIKTPTYTSLILYVFQADETDATTGLVGAFKKATFAVPTGEQNNLLETILTNNKSNFKFLVIAQGLKATNADKYSTNRAFLCRSKTLRSAVLNLEVSIGYSGTHTANAKLIETAFFIRS